MPSGQAPQIVKHSMNTLPVATAGNDLVTVAFRAPFAGTVSAVTYAPLAAINGAATNNRTFNLYNKGQTGVGATVVATLNMANGVNAAASDEKTIPLSGTPANLVVAAGDILTWESLHIATGIADPGGLVTVEFTRD